MKPTEVIYIESEALMALVDRVVNHLGLAKNTQSEQWINSDAAMKLLAISSKTTLQRLRDNGKIRFTTPFKKVILYDKQSIEEYLEQNAKECF